MNRVLLLEDEPQIGKNLRMVLQQENYDVDWFQTGDEAVESALEEDYDLMLLDVMLKNSSNNPVSHINNGLEVARVIRQKKDTPYILVTSRSDPYDIMQGLDSGADDYIPKPYDLSILLARMRAVLRRSNSSKTEPSTIKCSDIELDLLKHKTYIKGEEVDLTNQLFDILLFFIRNKNKIIPKAELYKSIWGYDPADSTQTNTLEVNIRRLRHKIGPDYIRTVRGKGYVLEE